MFHDSLEVEIKKELTLYFGAESIPNPHNYPQSYMWYVKIYHYKMSEKQNAKI